MFGKLLAGCLRLLHLNVAARPDRRESSDCPLALQRPTNMIESPAKNRFEDLMSRPPKGDTSSYRWMATASH